MKDDGFCVQSTVNTTVAVSPAFDIEGKFWEQIFSVHPITIFFVNIDIALKTNHEIKMRN